MSQLTKDQCDYVADRLFWGITCRSFLEEMGYEDITHLHKIQVCGAPIYFDLKGVCRSYQSENILLIKILDKRSGTLIEPVRETPTIVQTKMKEIPHSFMTGDFIIFIHVGDPVESDRLIILDAIRTFNNLLNKTPSLLYFDESDMETLLDLEKEKQINFLKRRFEELKPIRGL